MSRFRLALAASMLLTLASAGGCALLSGLSDYKVGAGGGGGGGGQSACEPGATAACYTGAQGTEGVGICKGGQKTCSTDGSGFGECVGQILPATAEDCDTAEDDDCDGAANESCSCTPKASQPCYSGPATTQGVGACIGGQQTCNAQGTGFGACVGEVVPTPELCDSPGDEDCDGIRCSESFVGSILKGTVNDGSSHVDSLVVDGAGNTYLTGILEGATDLGNSVTLDGTASSFLLKLDPAGLPQWAVQTPPNVSKLLVTLGASSFPVLAGEFSGSLPMQGKTLNSAGATDIFVAMLDKAGGLQAATSFGGAGTESLSALTVAGAHIFVGGEFSGGSITVKTKTVSLAVGVDAFLVKLANTPEPIDIWSFGSTMGVPVGNRALAALALDAGANVFLGLNFTGGAQIGNKEHTDKGGGDFGIVKLDATTLAPLWSTVVGSPSPDSLTALRVDAAGSVVAAFNTAGVVDLGGGPLGGSGSTGIGAAKFDLNGALKWSTSFPGSSATVDALALDSSGDIVLAGSVNGNVTFGAGHLLTAGPGGDAFLAKLSGTGVYQWSHLINGDGMQNTPRLAVEPNPKKNIALAFFNQGTANLESGPLTSNASGADDSIVVSRVFP
jgi:hypothetical protein